MYVQDPLIGFYLKLSCGSCETCNAAPGSARSVSCSITAPLWKFIWSLNKPQSFPAQRNTCGIIYNLPCTDDYLLYIIFIIWTHYIYCLYVILLYYTPNINNMIPNIYIYIHYLYLYGSVLFSIALIVRRLCPVIVCLLVLNYSSFYHLWSLIKSILCISHFIVICFPNKKKH